MNGFLDVSVGVRYLREALGLRLKPVFDCPRSKLSSRFGHCNGPLIYGRCHTAELDSLEGRISTAPKEESQCGFRKYRHIVVIHHLPNPIGERLEVLVDIIQFEICINQLFQLIIREQSNRILICVISE